MNILKLAVTALCAMTLSHAALAQEQTPPASEAAPHAKGPERFKEADANGDGAIDKAEFLAGAEKRFARMDANGDGKLTAEEMKALRDKFRAERAERKQP